MSGSTNKLKIEIIVQEKKSQSIENQEKCDLLYTSICHLVSLRNVQVLYR